MKQAISPHVPRYTDLILPTFLALKELGGSGNNDEILSCVTRNLDLPDEAVDFLHKGSESLSELAYQLAWARTYLKNYGVIENSARSVWSILPSYAKEAFLDAKQIVQTVAKKNAEKRAMKSKGELILNNSAPEDDGVEFPEEVKPWRQKLLEILQSMDPYGFERLAQRVLRECGFSQVEVTKKSGDGGIDGVGKLRIGGGILSFNVAFQCKRYSGIVGTGEVRDFRGSLSKNIEKGVLITTGSFSKAAKAEAADPSKQQIDLMDGEAFIDKIAEFGIGVREVRSYEIDEDYFSNI